MHAGVSYIIVREKVTSAREVHNLNPGQDTRAEPKLEGHQIEHSRSGSKKNERKKCRAVEASTVPHPIRPRLVSSALDRREQRAECHAGARTSARRHPTRRGAQWALRRGEFGLRHRASSSDWAGEAGPPLQMPLYRRQVKAPGARIAAAQQRRPKRRGGGLTARPWAPRPPPPRRHRPPCP